MSSKTFRVSSVFTAFLLLLFKCFLLRNISNVPIKRKHPSFGWINQVTDNDEFLRYRKRIYETGELQQREEETFAGEFYEDRIDLSAAYTWKSSVSVFSLRLLDTTVTEMTI